MVEKEVASLFTETIIQKGFHKFTVEAHSAKLLGDFENYIYEGVREGKKVILRYTHSSHRTYEQIISEIDWVAYLKKQGIQVYEHYVSSDGYILETVAAQDGSYFFICCYEKLPGKRITWQDCKNTPTYIEKWGEVIGQMHKATKQYVKPNDVEKRPEWYEEDLLNLDIFQQHYTSTMLEYSKEVLQKVQALSKKENNYGLIHSDLHLGNFNIHDNQLYLFDFDDSSYHFFASDLAIPLYYTLLSRNLSEKGDNKQFARFFMSHFLTGYQRHYQLHEKEIQLIPLFLRLRDVSLYNAMLKKYDLEHLSEKEAHLLSVVKERIVGKMAIFELSD